MTDAELLALARSFDAGPAPVVNGWIIPEGDTTSGAYRVLIHAAAGGTWSIVGFAGCCLGRDGLWADGGVPSERTEAFGAATRFASAREAFAFYRAWRPAEVERARAAGCVEWGPGTNREGGD